MFGISVTIAFIFLGVFWIVKISRSVFWLDLENKQRYQVTGLQVSSELYVLIPVLDEARILRETIHYFSDLLTSVGGGKIVIVTTEREYTLNERGGQDDTVLLVKELVAGYHNVIMFHYPKRDGKMAHQLNFAIRKISETSSLVESSLFAIYNADSRPSENTFQLVLSKYQRGESEVFQQYGDYTENTPFILEGGNLFRRAVLLSSMAWQNRWSLGFELPHAMNQFGYKRTPKSIWHPVNYCIGHGLFLSYSIVRKMDGFNETMHNEDAILGLQLSSAGITISPVPSFDAVCVPDTVKGLFLQQVSWFYGPLQAFEYYRYLTNKSGRQDFHLLLFSMKLFSHAVYWVVGPVAFFLILSDTIGSPSPIHFFELSVVWALFLVAPSYYAWRSMRNKKAAGSHEESKLLLYLFIGMPIFYILHGVAGVKSIIDYLLRFLFDYRIPKRKTMMNAGR